MKYTCPCCGYKTLRRRTTGKYEICNICYWEDDPVQFNDHDYEGGANEAFVKASTEKFHCIWCLRGMFRWVS